MSLPCATSCCPPESGRKIPPPRNLNDTAWFSGIDASGGAVFFASGVFYYFLTEQVKTLVQKMADAFPGGVLVFDAANRTADLKEPSVSGFFRFLAKVGDGMMKMQIVKIGFGGKV